MRAKPCTVKLFIILSLVVFGGSATGDISIDDSLTGIPDGGYILDLWAISPGDSAVFVSSYSCNCAAPNVSGNWYFDDAGQYGSAPNASHTYTQGGTYSPYLSLTCSCCGDTAQKTLTLYVVEVDHLEYFEPGTGYTDVPSTLYAPSDVSFRAVPNPSAAFFPPGKPLWGGTSGASGTGSTKLVELPTDSSSTSDYKTVTATCGNTVTANVIVWSVEGYTDPQDDEFSGSDTRYGVYEKVDLGCDITPSGLSGSNVGGLEWKVDGGGSVSLVTNDGTGLYTAPTSGESVTLYLEAQSGPAKGDKQEFERTIVEPDGGTCAKRSGTLIAHTQYCFSIGVNTLMHLTPTDVSFDRLEFTEGLCDSDRTGWFANNPDFTVSYHTEWGFWVGVGDGASGGVVEQMTNGYLTGDYAALKDINPPAYSNGTFTWPIPWSYKAGAFTKEFYDMPQKFWVYSNGKAEVEKDSSGRFYNYHNSPGQIYHPTSPPYSY